MDLRLLDKQLDSSRRVWKMNEIDKKTVFCCRTVSFNGYKLAYKYL